MIRAVHLRMTITAAAGDHEYFGAITSQAVARQGKAWMISSRMALLAKQWRAFCQQRRVAGTVWFMT